MVVLSAVVNIALFIFLSSGYASAGNEDVVQEQIVEVLEPMPTSEQEPCPTPKTVYVPTPVAEPPQPKHLPRTIISENRQIQLRNCAPDSNGEWTCSISSQP
jgi:hypothetical protein